MVRIALAALVLAGCSYAPSFKDCEVACDTMNQCPTGFSCAMGNMCRPTGMTGPCGSGDGGVPALAQQAYVKASNTDSLDQFGFSVALSGDGSTLAVGAPLEGSAAAEADNSLPGAGAVYVFVRTGASWAQEAYVKPFNPGTSFEFGFSVALSTDGMTLAVGSIGEDSSNFGVNPVPNHAAVNAGAVYVFARAGSSWTQQAYLKASNTDTQDLFGTSVALSSDGSTVAVGAIGEASLGSPGDNTAPGAGAVYVFTRANTTWTQDAYLKARVGGMGDNFGQSVALSSSGATLAVGANGERSSSTGINGSDTNNSLTGAGAVYVFTRAGIWTQQAYVKSSNTAVGSAFGEAVALSASGSTLAVGSPGESSQATGIDGDQSNIAAFSNAGAVYVFNRVGTAWAQQAYVKASNTGMTDFFGWSVSLSMDGSTLAVGARSEDSGAMGIGGNQNDDSVSDAGAVYLYTRAVTTWSQEAYVKASNPDMSDAFGGAAALSSDASTLAVGAIGEASNARGIDGTQSDNSEVNSGAVYVFR